MNKIFFEMGQRDNRNLKFDHHEANGGHNLKMASVQLIEYLICTDSIDKFNYNDVELNHVGHLDDFVLFAIKEACEYGKLRNLYKFACMVSSLDSMGPIAYKLINDKDRDLINLVYETYQNKVSEIATNKNIDRRNLELVDKIEASKYAARILVDRLESDQYNEMEHKVPRDECYEIQDLDEVAIIETVDPTFNPMIYSGYFYKKFKLIIGFKKNPDDENKFDYSIMMRSVFDGDLSPLWNELKAIEPGWGGHAGAGGSPRKNGDVPGGSGFPPYTILKMIHDLKII